jgi:hypothetical protein
VATVLRHGRLRRRRNPHHRNLDGSSLPWLGDIVAAATWGDPLRRKGPS